MDYTGEHLLPGMFGHFFITLSVVASLVATFAYFKTTTAKLEESSQSWRQLARIAFMAECISVFAVFSILFYIIYSHLFEYKYAWQHSSRSLEVKYLLSCFWEGQEGSFLLWSIWHCVLGLILIRTSKKWEAPVMTVVSFAQFCLATMIAGFYFFGHKVGSNPFVLLRNEGILDGAPNFLDPETGLLRKDYLSFVKDGNDLNPLLQNYWMVIHPPVLFLGFASTIVPFAFAIAGLWTKNFKEITKQVLPWATFSIAVLGTGIMMGGAWAYESLNFGGYWAWDPVENASLVPWLTLVAGAHTLLIFKHTGRSLRVTYLMLIITFLLVVYSTFLTRSGVLGDTSVHAFTDLGMNTQLLLFMLVFVVPSLLLFFIRYKQIPNIASEEQTSSREFWMFIGSIVFFLAALFIIIGTSLPVINKIFGSKFTMGADVVYSYNRILIFVAIILGLLTAVTQYLRYKATPTKVFWKKILWPTIISAIISAIVLAFGNINYTENGGGFLIAIWLATALSIYAIIANAAYIWLGVNGKLKLAGGSVAHFGFALLLLGILISSSKKEILSYNTSGIFVPMGEGSKEKAGENLTLIRNVPTTMGNYSVTYEADSVHPKKPLWFYKLHFKNKNSDEQFTLMPNAFVNYKNNQGLMANPDAKHFWTHDIFTYITSLPDPDKNKDTSSFQPREMKIGDTAYYSAGFYVLENVTTRDSIPMEGMAPQDEASIAAIKVYSKNGTKYNAQSLLITKKDNSFSVPDTVQSESLVFQLEKLGKEKYMLGVKESNSMMQYLTLKAYKFPFIKFVWFGTLIMVIGLLMSTVRRIQLNKMSKDSENLSF